jgi:hypothetical protein
VDLHGQVLAGAEGPADPGQAQPHLPLGQAQAGGDLRLVDVQPLGCDVQVDPAVLGGHRETGLGAEERLVLHAHLVAAADHDLGPRLRVALADAHMPDQVAAGVDAVRLRAERGFGVGDRGHHLVADTDRRHRPARGLRMVGRHDDERLTLVTDLGAGQHRLVDHLQAERLAPGHVVVGQHGRHPGDPQRSGQIDRGDARPGVGGAQGGTPQHAVHPQVGRECELAHHLQRPVRAQDGGPHAAGHLVRRRPDVRFRAGRCRPGHRGLFRAGRCRAGHPGLFRAGRCWPVIGAPLRPPRPWRGQPGARPPAGPRRGSSRSRCTGTGCRPAPP